MGYKDLYTDLADLTAKDNNCTGKKNENEDDSMLHMFWQGGSNNDIISWFIGSEWSRIRGKFEIVIQGDPGWSIFGEKNNEIISSCVKEVYMWNIARESDQMPDIEEDYWEHMLLDMMAYYCGLHFLSTLLTFEVINSYSHTDRTRKIRNNFFVDHCLQCLIDVQ